MRAILKTILTAFVLCCIQASSLRAQEGLVSNAIERAALQAIYDNMNGAHWSAGNRWPVTRINSYPDSALTGITIVNGDIVSISFGSMGISGTLPAELNTLTQLTVMRIIGAQLSNVLPNLSNLTKLTEFSLANCNITTVGYPSWLGVLTELELLHLQGNNFQGPLPGTIGQLTVLEELNLSGNDLSMADAIPNTFSNLDNLGNLNLTNCKLQPASVTTGLSGLNGLHLLTLDNNPQFSDQGVFPDRLANLPALEILSLQANGFNSFPVSLASLSGLNTVYLGMTNYSNAARLGSTIDVLKACAALRTIYLNSCSIVSLPADFDELAQVRTLVMDNNVQMNPGQCLELGYMSTLTTLFVQNCNLTALPTSLSQSTSLRKLQASQNDLFPLPAVLKEIPALELLDLSSNGINELPVWFGEGTMNSIKRLYLNINGLIKLNDSFVNMTQLNLLSIYTNKLGSDWPDGFEQLSSMDTLNLANNLIDALPDMTTWGELKFVDLNRNKLHGTVPVFLTNGPGKHLNVVDISENQYSNIAPGSNYSGTTRLALDHNKFTFEELVPLIPSGSYTYAPQDSTVVDSEREVYAYLGQTATFVAYADTKPGLNTLYQWFRRLEDGSDIAVSPRSSEAKHFTYSITEQDQGATFYYKVTHGSLTQVVLTSRLQTLIIKCDILPTALGFSTKKYACAMNFVPVSTYPNGCRTKAYTWNFGDNTSSIEKSPFHAYGGAGTFNVTMKIRYSCGVCIRDTIVTKSITFNPNEDFLMDSLLTVVTDQKPQVLAASAATFADAWPLQYEASGISEEGLANGADGIWRNEGTYVYKKPRKASEVTDIAHDGTFDLDQFNWAMAEAEAIPDWIKANTMTQYSPYSYELENRDVLGVYTAALYDYGGHLPSANGVNMRHREMAFTSFEYFDSLSSGNWMFGNVQLPRYTEYEVYSARSHVAIVKASQAQMENTARVDVMSRGYLNLAWFGLSRSNYIANDPIVCTLPYPNNPDWSIIVLRREPFTGVWNGKIRVRNMQAPVVKAVVDDTKGHAGSHSLYVAGQKTFQQPRLELDSGKAYLVTAWAFTGNMSPLTPKLAENLAIRVVLRDKEGNIIQTHDCTLTGNIIEGWQQVRGVFTCPRKWAKVELTFNSGASPQAWFDDLRLHPEKGNMKTYVYDVRDYRLHAILDEENFGSFFFYDKEGNLYLTQKETEEGIKTISENVSYMTETH